MAKFAPRIALALGAFSLHAAVLACPPGQYEVCVTACICLPDAKEVIGPLPGEVSQVAADALQQWLVQSRAAAAAAGTEAIPPEVRRQLLPYYDAALLDAVRYRIGDSSELSAASAMLQNPDIKAVTLIDIIVFRFPEGATEDLALWAHELRHVQQYREWGVEEFAARYTRDPDSVEGPAYEMQFRVAKELREKGT
ncbi:DUF4157 domain-containing protein [Pseudomonas sp. BN102]|uniref:eCIS core domain-containing protein n=1 Tax=Pseudomonas sp. BN102 TaxID=2567886 RepID=UPI002455EE89|nr:DUF4157 domain-containing protein [Pseudomonas sp. BN102]MDH4608707.1 DUF4157 domain-containing protein [Pseudomonas sp. BN102]